VLSLWCLRSLSKNTAQYELRKEKGEENGK